MGSKFHVWPISTALLYPSRSSTLFTLTSRMVTAPLDIIKIRMQLADGRLHIADVVKLTLRNEGVVAFWKGNVPAEIMYILYGALQFALYQTVNRWLSAAEQTWADSTVSKVIKQPLVHSLVTGFTAGASSTLVTYPFDLLRTRLAANRDKGLARMLTTMKLIFVNEGGFRGFFAGIQPTMLAIALNTGLMFSTYTKARQIAERHLKIPFIEGICGFVAGATAKAITFPLDTLRKRCQMTLDYRTSWVGLARGVVARGGVRGLYNGFTVALVKTAPTSAISMWAYEWSLSLIVDGRLV